jgi:hypothetical protein
MSHQTRIYRTVFPYPLLHGDDLTWTLEIPDYRPHQGLKPEPYADQWEAPSATSWEENQYRGPVHKVHHSNDTSLCHHHHCLTLILNPHPHPAWVPGHLAKTQLECRK